MQQSGRKFLGLSALQWLNCAGTVIFLGINAISATPAGVSWGIFRSTNAEVSAANPTPVTPAGYAFSIWSVIFILVLGFTVVQALPSRRAWTEARGWWYFVNAGVLQLLWPFSFSYAWGDYWLSAILLPLITATLAGLYLNLDIGVAPWPPAPPRPAREGGATAPPIAAPALGGPLLKRVRRTSLLDMLFVEHAISLYMGWCTVASIVNITVALLRTAAGRDGLGWTPLGWSILLLLAAFALGTIGIVTRTDYAYTAAVAWALLAIGRQQANGPAFAAYVEGVGGAATALGWLLVIQCVAALAWRGMLWRWGRLQFVAFAEVSKAAAADPVRGGAASAGGVGAPLVTARAGAGGPPGAPVAAWGERPPVAAAAVKGPGQPAVSRANPVFGLAPQL